MGKFTPGPWRWTTGMNGVRLMADIRGQLVVMDCIRSGFNGADLMFSDRNGELRGGYLERAKGLDLNSHPDARLIAASPDLYEALCGLLASADAAWEVTNAGHDWKEACEAARAALAKADGEVTP